MLPITHPENGPDIRTLRGRMHDLKQPLTNPDPKTDWTLNDIAWVYAEKHQAIVYGPITFINNDFVSVRDITNRNTDVYIANKVYSHTDELFVCHDDLLATLFACG